MIAVLLFLLVAAISLGVDLVITYAIKALVIVPLVGHDVSFWAVFCGVVLLSMLLGRSASK